MYDKNQSESEFEKENKQLKVSPSESTTSIEKLISNSNRYKKNISPRIKSSQKQQISLIGKFRQCWDNLNFRTKLTVVLISGISIPVIAVTQGIVALSQANFHNILEEELQIQLNALEAKIKIKKKNIHEKAKLIRKFIEHSQINPTLLNSNDNMGLFLSESLEEFHSDSFYLILDSNGSTIAQDIQIINQDFSEPPRLLRSQREGEESEGEYKKLSLPLGIKLNDIEIVREALENGKSFSGFELLKGEYLQRLGLEEQAKIEIRDQDSENSPTEEQQDPAIDNGNAGLLIIAVEPIELQGKIIGATIVGNLINRNYTIVDQLFKVVDEATETQSNSTASIFAKNWLVSTNIPYLDGKTRAIGTQTPPEVADKVLNQEEEFIGYNNILGTQYLTGYLPIYRVSEENQEKPIGMIHVGKPQTDIDNTLRKIAFTGYGIGITILILASFLVVPFIANSFSYPLNRIARFAQKVRSGEKGLRVEEFIERSDEIGTLAREMNQMVASVESSIEARLKEAKRDRLITKIASTRNLDSLIQPLNHFLEEINETLMTDRVVIYRFNPDLSGYIAAEALSSPILSALKLDLKDACIPEALIKKYKERRVVINHNVFEANLHSEHLDLLIKLDVKSNLVVPIISGENLFGLLIAHHCQDFRKWEEFEIDYLEQEAQRLGLAMSGFSLLEQKELEAKRQREQNESLQRELLQLLTEVEEASSGDLTVRAEISAGQIGIVADFFNAIIESMREIVARVKESTSQVNVSLRQDEQAMRSLADESLKQAKKIQRMLDFVENMGKSIEDVASNATAAAEVAKKASHTARNGGVAMDSTVDSIVQLRSTVSETAKKVKRLGESSQQISKVISLINQIALQTNLLAINASIEAARAGEEGRGFAVVAEEVGELAAQSAAATKDIQKIVENIQEETSEVVEAMERGTSEVVEGTRLVEQTKQSLQEIVQVSEEIDDLLQLISTATVSQNETSDKVTNLMKEIAKVSELTSDSSRQVSSSLQETVELGEKLQESVGIFKVDTENLNE